MGLVIFDTRCGNDKEPASLSANRPFYLFFGSDVSHSGGDVKRYRPPRRLAFLPVVDPELPPLRWG